MPVIVSILAYFVVAAFVWWLADRGNRLGAAVAAVPYVAQLGLIGAIAFGAIDEGTEVISWIPSLSVEIGVVTNALTLTLSAVVAGIGLLIVAYASSYFGDTAKRNRFMALLLVFTGGMAGIVVSDELLGLFVFWEITTIASYLLIGFDDEKAAARSAALEAILVTTAGGLAMLAGFIVLIMEAGTSTISEIVAAPPSGTATTIALILIFIGAFAKSAQFPFHFWLPRAMAAPTPASAYLHSATMVKAGIVLLLFLAPGFATTDVWTWTVTSVGLITMALGAMTALGQRDMKLLLAHGTVSQLGFMTALIGLGYTAAALAVLIGHSLFKATLFLVTGIVDTSTGTRDIDKLSGLRRPMPTTAIAGAIAAASMAGIPPLVGFVTKEAAVDTLVSGEDWLALAVIAAASVVTVAYAARWWFGAFAGSETTELKQRPRTWMVAPVVVLSILTVAFGIAPSGMKDTIVEATGQSIKLVLWPGLGVPLLISTAIIIIGAGLYVAIDRRSTPMPHLPRSFPTGQRAYEQSVVLLNRTADVVTGRVQNGSLPVYLAVIVTSVLLVPALSWATNWDARVELPWFNTIAEAGLVSIVIVGAMAATIARRRMAAALLLGVVGYAIAGVFVVFSAPDLALTQLLIETLTVALFALVLARLPRLFGTGPASLSRQVRLAIAIGVGAFITVAAAMTSTVSPDRSLTEEYIAQSPDAGGTNVVNIILTNFRALDTLGEITVLAAAAIGIAALVGRQRIKREDDR